MNTKKILGVVAVLALVAVALVGAGAAASTAYYVDDAGTSETLPGTADAPLKANYFFTNVTLGNTQFTDKVIVTNVLTTPANYTAGQLETLIANSFTGKLIIGSEIKNDVFTIPAETTFETGTTAVIANSAVINVPVGAELKLNAQQTSTWAVILGKTVTIEGEGKLQISGVVAGTLNLDVPTTIGNTLTVTGNLLWPASSDVTGTIDVQGGKMTVYADAEECDLTIAENAAVKLTATKDNTAELNVWNGYGSIVGDGTLYITSYIDPISGEVLKGCVINAYDITAETVKTGASVVRVEYAENLNENDLHLVIYETDGTALKDNGGILVTKKAYAITAKSINGITALYGGNLLGLTDVNVLYITTTNGSFIVAAYNDAGEFANFEYSYDGENWYSLPHGATTSITYDEVYLRVNGTTAVTSVDNTVVNAFYYVQGYNDGENPVLVPGRVYVDSNGNSFNVPSTTVEDWYLTPEMAPAGTYFHMIGTGSDDYDQVVYVSAPKLSYSKIKESTLYVDEKTAQTITIENASKGIVLQPYIIFEKADVEGVFVDFPVVNVAYNNGVGVFTFNGNEFDYADFKGTWNVYADFSRTYDGTKVVEETALYNKTPVEYKYVQIGSFKIVADKTDKDSTLTVTTDEITDGNVFSITVGSDYTTGYKVESGEVTATKVPTNYVTVEYYEDGDKADDAVKITDSTKNKFFYVKNQTNYVSTEYQYTTDGGETYKTVPTGVFTIPATKEVTIGIQANVKALTDKTYHFEVYTSQTADEKKGGSDSPMTFDVKVKGNTFTANLAKTSYVKGENVTVEGSYSNTDENFKPYVYVEGTNTAFFAPSYATKYTSASGASGTAAKTVKDGEFTLIFDASNFNELNAGTYTVYVSKEICKEVANIDTLADAKWPQYSKSDATATKLETIENAKVLTLVLKESMIEITSVTKEVQAGKNTNNAENVKGYYLTAQIEAEGANNISLYIVGQNKLFYIDGSTARKDGYVKSLNKNEGNYLFDESASNLYAYEGIATDKSVSKVAQKLGVYDDGDYPLFLIIDNENGTFTAYIHIQASGEENDYDFDTKLGLGQYYLVAQHPMADGVFNTGAVLAGTEGSIYTSGADVYTNDAFMFNVPALQNLEAAQALVNAIEAGNDSQHGKDFYVVAQANDAEFIKAPEASYKQGETITIVISNVNGTDYDNGTLEANTFDFTAENLNYIQTFVATKKTNEDTGLETITFSLDTSEVPGGDYVIVLKDDEGTVLKVYETKIIAQTTPVVEVTVSIAGASSLTVGDTTVLTAKNSDGSTAKFAWKSSDASVASVDENGNVVAKKAGTVTITVENTVTGKTATKTIVVADQSTPVTPTPTKTPGFGILAALAGLGAVAALVLRRK